MQKTLTHPTILSNLQGEIQAAQQVLEARVGAQAIENGILEMLGQKGRAFLVGLFRPAEGLILLSHTGID
jgi:hypothetical protein